MARTFLLGLSFLFFAAPQIQSQSGSGVAILNSSLAALGGAQGQVPATYVASGTQTDLTSSSSGAPSTVYIEVLMPDKFLWVIQGPNGTVTTLVNGQYGQVRNNNGNVSVTSSQLSGSTAACFPIFELTQLLGRPSMRANLVGQETVNGQLVNHIAVRGLLGVPLVLQLPGDGYEVYADTQTSLPVRLRAYQIVANSYVPPSLKAFVTIDITFSQYQLVNGFKFPSAFTWSANGRDKYSIQLSSIQVNVPVNPNDFSLVQSSRTAAP